MSRQLKENSYLLNKNEILDMMRDHRNDFSSLWIVSFSAVTWLLGHENPIPSIMIIWTNYTHFSAGDLPNSLRTRLPRCAQGKSGSYELLSMRTTKAVLIQRRKSWEVLNFSISNSTDYRRRILLVRKPLGEEPFIELAVSGRCAGVMQPSIGS